MEEELRQLLLGDATIAGLVGARVHWQRRPQGMPLPAIVLTAVSRTDEPTLDGPTSPVDRRVQVDAYATTYADAKTLERAVISRLHGFRGTRGNIHFLAVFLVTARDLPEDTETGFLSRASMDFLITYTEAN